MSFCLQNRAFVLVTVTKKFELLINCFCDIIRASACHQVVIFDRKRFPCNQLHCNQFSCHHRNMFFRRNEIRMKTINYIARTWCLIEKQVPSDDRMRYATSWRYVIGFVFEDPPSFEGEIYKQSFSIKLSSICNGSYKIQLFDVQQRVRQRVLRKLPAI